MTSLQRTIDMFEDTGEIASVKQDFILLYSSTEKVRRGVYAKVSELKKENDRLKSEIDEIKSFLKMGLQSEKVGIDDLPLFQLAFGR